jgi:hypothetical protein
MPEPRPLSDEEAAEALKAALAGPGGTLTRTADLYLASMAAEALVERLWRAGVVLASLRP